MQEKVTKQVLIEMALSEQIKERQEMEKKLHKLRKTVDHFEHAKMDEQAPLVDQAYQQRLQDERILHESEQLVCFFLVVIIPVLFG